MTVGGKQRIVGGMLILAAALISAAVGVRYWPRPSLAEIIPSSTAVLDREGRLLRLTLAPDQQYRLWTPLEEIPPELVKALLLHEDRHFYLHLGTNPIALMRAAGRTYTGGARQGGSTLTMQLARLLYDLDTRSVGGKLEQMTRALALELKYSKHDLLEAHLNLMPYGGNIQGVGAASRIYFGKRPADLQLIEALTLVVIPQSPALRDPARGESPSLRAARHRLFARWTERHPESTDQTGLVNLGLRYASPRALPFQAPHFTNRMLPSSSAVIETTLDLQQQRLLERVLQHFIRENEHLGIRNAAALLVDYREMNIRAAIGSARFFDTSIDGQVNGTTAKRSPGSALKPFVYALAMDQGLIHPLTVLKDSPASFGAFSPENFDGRFAGPITATDALARSRNVPAMALSARLKQPDFYHFLHTAGISRMASEQHYGLSLTLGGGEVTMEELVTLYAMLANRGELKPLRAYRGNSPDTAYPTLLSQEASFMTLEMLKENPRPDDSTVRPRGRLPVAWKTGTSWGFRDAWSVGIFGPYVLAVWVGNFDGSSNPSFVGVQTAAPLFFRMVDALQVADPGMPPYIVQQPPRLARVEVCADSGELPNADCPRTVTTWFIPGRSPIRVSDVHRRVWIDIRTDRKSVV